LNGAVGGGPRSTPVPARRLPEVEDDPGVDLRSFDLPDGLVDVIEPAGLTDDTGEPTSVEFVGKTKSGQPITDEVVNELAEKAEAGYDVDESLHRRGGRPPMGTAALLSTRFDSTQNSAKRSESRRRARAGRTLTSSEKPTASTYAPPADLPARGDLGRVVRPAWARPDDGVGKFADLTEAMARQALLLPVEQGVSVRNAGRGHRADGGRSARTVAGYLST
jgi:hypothetical protein